MAKVTKVGIVGFGHLGKYLVDKILQNPEHFELTFVWNRSGFSADSSDCTTTVVEPKFRLENLDDFVKHPVDLIIEVSHPVITKNYGHRFLEHADYVIGSPTALADKELLDSLLGHSELHKHRMLVPCGAFWGAEDIRKMSSRQTLKGLRITMKKHPDSLKLTGSLQEEIEKMRKSQEDQAKVKVKTLYDGPVRQLCDLAPNNVNTMAVGALVAHNLGFDSVVGCLVADKSLTDRHIIEIEVTGPFNEKAQLEFKCTTTRLNPAVLGHVTGNATYGSFYNSLLEIVKEDQRSGLKVC